MVVQFPLHCARLYFSPANYYIPVSPQPSRSVIIWARLTVRERCARTFSKNWRAERVVFKCSKRGKIAYALFDGVTLKRRASLSIFTRRLRNAGGNCWHNNAVRLENNTSMIIPFISRQISIASASEMILIFRTGKVHFAIFSEIARLRRVGLQTLLNLKHLVVRFSDNRGRRGRERELLRTRGSCAARRWNKGGFSHGNFQRTLATLENTTVARPEYASCAKFIRHNSASRFLPPRYFFIYVMR